MASNLRPPPNLFGLVGGPATVESSGILLLMTSKISLTVLTPPSLGVQQASLHLMVANRVAGMFLQPFDPAN